MLDQEFGDTLLGDAERIRTGLAIVVKRLDTGSTWIVHNNPRGKYFNSPAESQSIANKDFSLQDIVRASTAAPHYFEPEPIEIFKGEYGAFVDGGVSPHNNPSLQLLMLAWLEGYGLNWPKGSDNLLLVSIGTGSADFSMKRESVMQMGAAKLAVRALGSIMDDASALNELLLQIIFS